MVARSDHVEVEFVIDELAALLDLLVFENQVVAESK